MKINEIKQYLEELNDVLEKKHTKGEICIVGGAAMCLAFNAREAAKE